MKIQQGACIQSSETMDDPLFKNSIVFITEFNDKGATGFILYKVLDRGLNDLEEFRNSVPYPIYYGGPVGEDHLYFIHKRPDLIEQGSKIIPGFYFNGDFDQALKAINNGVIQSDQLKIFKGYCGWDFGELEAEIEEGSWTVIPGESQDIFAREH